MADQNTPPSNNAQKEALRKAALEYHEFPTPGKLAIAPTKVMANQRDLALAYSPGVAFACEEIEKDPSTSYRYTSRGNLVAVVTNGTAVLGLGAIGALAAKPVMEGKAVLFKRFADVDSIDLEVDTKDVDQFVNCVRYLGPTFGGINLEDIKAPDCFVIEQRLRELMNIPVFHDDQHGTAIITAAGLVNALHLTGRDIRTARMVVNGAGAAGIACLELIKAMGMPHENAVLCDTKGPIWRGRTEGMNQWKSAHAVDTKARSLAEAVKGADIFLGLSVKGAMTADMVRSMAAKPIIFACANPDPEITPEEVAAVRSDAIVATGRSDYPNQVNNVLCFPYIFRGALDVGATTINEEMKLACVRAIAELARKEASDLGAAYSGELPSFGPEYLIPRPFDPRLLVSLAPAVAKAAMESGVATRPITDMRAYVEKLNQFVFRTGLLMKPVFERARGELQRVVYAEGEEENVLRAVQSVVDEGLARPILIGRPAVIETRIQRAGLRLQAGRDFDLTNIDDDPRFADYWQHYLARNERRGVTPSMAKAIVRSRATVIASIMVDRGEADAMICGTVGRFHSKLKHVLSVIPPDSGACSPAAMTAVANDKGVFFFVDTHVQNDPTAQQIADAALQAGYRLRLFGITPKVALLSHSNFGSHDSRSAQKMREALAIIRDRSPKMEVEGEMHADAALDEGIRERIFPNSLLKGRANLFVLPNLDAANIAYNMVRVMTDGVAIGPILMGVSKPAHVLTPASTVRRIVNMTALAAVEAQIRAQMGERFGAG